MRASLVMCIFGSVTLASAGTGSATVTFYKDVLPVLQKNCQTCHRPGEIAPASFLSYESTRPWAKSIKTAVLTKKMPPWFADAHYGKFSNDRSLAESDIHTLVSWVDAGAPAGDTKDAPKPVDWVEGWRIGKPDAVISMPIEYQRPGFWNHRLSIHRDSHRFHGRQVRSVGGGAAGQSQAGPSHHRFRARAGQSVAEGCEAGRTLRSERSGVESRGSEESSKSRKRSYPAFHFLAISWRITRQEQFPR